MKANEFVRRFGWNDARVCTLNCACPEDRWLMRHGELISDGDFDDLKRLVESYELVEKLGGLQAAKDYVPDNYKSECLKQAIADVESCMEVNNEA